MKLKVRGSQRIVLWNWGVLGKAAERAVLRDWLTKDGGANGDPTAWIDAIAKESHQWPQHFMVYVDPAWKQLNEHRGVMTAEGLETVLEAGREARMTYYEHRVRGYVHEHRRSFARVFANVPAGECITGTAMLAPLTQEYGFDEVPKVYRRALRDGVLHTQAGGYAVPVQSMQELLDSPLMRAAPARESCQ